MKEQPLVSIIIPTYNRAHLIGETLDSVLAQTYTHWECIVVDDGSTDGTDEVLARYVEKDSRFQYHHRPKDRLKGANACRNYGFELSTGEYIQWLDSDDLISHGKLNEQVDILKKKKKGIVICEWFFLEDYSKEVRHVNINWLNKSELSIKLFLKILSKSYGYMPPHTYLMSSELVSKAGKWNENLIINQDGEFFIRVFIKVKRVFYIESAKIFYRQGNLNKTSRYSSKEKAMAAIDSWKIILGNLSPYKRYLFKDFLFVNLYHLKINILNSYPELASPNYFFFRNYRNKIKRIVHLIFY